MSKGFAEPQLLIDPPALASALGLDGGARPAPPFSAAPLVLDLRPAEEYAKGHLPGATHVDLWGLSLNDTDEAPCRAFLWAIHHMLESRGVSDARPVVLYEEDSGMRVARAFWFLEYFAHPDVRVLDGGLAAWRAAGLPVTTDAETPKSASWTAGAVRERLASWRDVALRLNHDDVAILDTRALGEYTGATVRAKRGGAIPGAIHIEWKRNLAADGAFKPAADLRQMYESAGVTPDKEVVTYCQGGYRAAHSYLALRLLGYPRVRNYIGSWKEWGDRHDLPIERPS